MKDEFIFTIDNSIIQYHASNKSFRIGLQTFNTMCVKIDDFDNYLGPNYYVLKKLPQPKIKITIKLVKWQIDDLKAGDLIYTSHNNDIKISDMNIRENFGLVLRNYKNNCLDLVRVHENDICFIPNASPEKIYKVVYEESNS